MSPKSENGFSFTASTSADGTALTLVAHKDDHEGRRTEVFALTPDTARDLAKLIEATCKNAKDRRKVIRQAARAADQSQPT